MAIISTFAGRTSANSFAYGVNTTAPAGLLVLSGSSATSSSYTLVCQPQKSVNPNLASCVPTTTTPITVGVGSVSETVTPSAVSTDQLGNILITATFTYGHQAGDMVRSGTVGLQEALNAVSGYGGGVVVVDGAWTKLGGTQAMLLAAVIPADVDIEDLRFGIADGNYTTTLTVAQVTAMPTTSVELLPAPGANSYWQVTEASVVCLSAGTAFAAGSALTIGYGSTVPTNALSGTIAAAVLTTSTTTEVIQVSGSGLTTQTAGTLVLNKGIYINSATTAFTGGTGTVQVTIQAENITT